MLTQVLERATLTRAGLAGRRAPRGRLGEHGPELAELLGRLQAPGPRAPGGDLVTDGRCGPSVAVAAGSPTPSCRC